jgi:Flp pilus assembly pilin Flp
MTNWMNRFWKSSAGVSSVEFALIAPLMLTLFLGMIELSDGLTAKRKVTAATSTVADLVSRANTISNSDVTDVYAAASAILAPFDTSEIEVRITSVVVNLDGTTEVGWGDALNTDALDPGDDYILPSGLGLPGGSVIVGEVTYEHMGLVGHFLGRPKVYSEIFFSQPRRTLQIERL